MGGLVSMREASDVRTRLASVDPQSCPKWAPQPRGNLVRIVDVYDGDTLTALCLLGESIFKYSVRLRGVDCPEVRGRGQKEREAALCIRDLVRLLCLDKICELAPFGMDKYGRLIAEIVLPDGTNLSLFLLESSLARKYMGKARKAFSEDEIATMLTKTKELCSRYHF